MSPFLTQFERRFLTDNPGMIGPLKRGTPEWDERERMRASIGCQCMSLGAIESGLGYGEQPTEAQQKEIGSLLRGTG